MVSVFTRNRPRGLPALGDSIEPPADDVMDASNTPFRLPKVGGEKKEGEELYKVWSRYGYEYHNKKYANLYILNDKIMLNIGLILHGVW